MKYIILFFAMYICLTDVSLNAGDTQKDYAATVDFEIVPLSADIRYTFPIANLSSETMYIHGISASCDCIHITYYPSQIPPGKKTDFEIRYLPEKSGSYAYEIELDSTAGKMKFLVTVDVVERGKPKKLNLQFPLEMITRKLRAKNRDLFISPKKILNGNQPDFGFTLVDVRSAEEYERYNIPGSLHIPLFAVKSKPFLRGKRVVLINDGHSIGLMEKECVEINNRGVDAVILDGGLSYWKKCGGWIEGDFFALQAINILAPHTYFDDKNYDDWIVINTQRSVSVESDILMPNAVHIPYETLGGQAFISKIAQLIERHDQDYVLPILLFDLDGSSYEQLRQAVSKLKNANIYFLEDGIKGYISFLEKQNRIMNPSFVERSEKGCSNCP